MMQANVMSKGLDMHQTFEGLLADDRAMLLLLQVSPGQSCSLLSVDSRGCLSVLAATSSWLCSNRLQILCAGHQTCSSRKQVVQVRVTL
jgi:hypothetical protein